MEKSIDFIEKRMYLAPNIDVMEMRVESGFAESDCPAGEDCGGSGGDI